MVTKARYMLDTDIVSYLRKQQIPQLARRFDRLHHGEAVLSVVTYGELLYGARLSSDPGKAMQEVQRLSSVLAIMPMPESAAEEYGAIRAELSKKGSIIGNNDLWIAAHALAEDLILVTNNEREFKRVKGLKIENWTK